MTVRQSPSIRCRPVEAASRRTAAERRALTARLNVVREAECAALARELHDNFGQNLTALQLGLQWLDRQMQSAKPGDLAALRDSGCPKRKECHENTTGR